MARSLAALVSLAALSTPLTTIGAGLPQSPTPSIQTLLNRASRATDARGKYRAFVAAIAEAHAVHDLYGEAEGSFYAAKSAEVFFDWDDAIKNFDHARGLYQGVGADRDTGVALHELGIAYNRSGDRKSALKYFGLALPAERSALDGVGEGATRLAMGQVYDELGERQRALASCFQALERFGRAEPRRAAIAHNYVGKIYEELGRRREALHAYRTALPLFVRVHDDRGRAQTLTNIGVTYDNLGRQRGALRYYARALPLWHGEQPGRGATLNDWGKALKELGDYRGALDYYGRALKMRRQTGDFSGQAVTINNIGRAYVELARPQDALDCYAEALPLERQTGEREAEAITLRNCAYAAAKLNQASLAIAFGKRSVDLFQTLRSDLLGMGREVRQSYANEVRPAYRFLADLLISQGRLAEAEEVMDLLKDDEYFAFVRSAKPEGVDLTTSEAAWKLKYDALGDELARDATEFETLQRLPELTPIQNSRREALDKALQSARQAYLAFLRGAQSAFVSAGADHERIDDLRTYTQLASIVRAMPTPTAAIYTLVTEDGVRTILTLPNVTELRSAPTLRMTFAALSRKVALLRTALMDPRLDPVPLACEFYELLIRPLRRELEAAGVRSLLVSLDGPLRYLPVAALYDVRARAWLCEQYSVSLFTPANLLKMNDAPASVARAAGFGVTREHVAQGLHFSALSSVHRELETLRDVMGASVYEDANFTAESLRRELARGDTLIHLATHFELRAGDAASSFLLLGDGTTLSISDFAGWRQDVLGGVDLCVVSACDTATPSADGGEFESFARAAQENGAAAVLATLWPVNDASTGLFMAHLYALRKAEPAMTKSEAIRQTQIWLMKFRASSGPSAQRAGSANSPTASAGLGSYHVDPTHPFAHPYYWAPFVLTGNIK